MEDTNIPQITLRDWQIVEKYVKDEHASRKGAKHRQDAERVWKEVDRMVRMESPKVSNADPNDWHSSVELGELAKASEIITADVLRLTFPNVRANFEAHVELPVQLDPNTGKPVQDEKNQEFADGTCRALMVQQHMDFGLKARLSLSIKEALHHGCFVAEVRGEDTTLFDKRGGIENRHAPAWVPHSMWNCWPDPSPSVLSTDIFYTGSMIIQEFMPLHSLKKVAMSGINSGWMPSQVKKIKRRQNMNKDIETQDIELVKYFGDLVIDRKNGEDIYLPNSKVILANGTIVFYSANPYPFQPIIYNGYERLDVRDPYYTSPLIKQSPLHKLATTLANKLVDVVALHGEPPGTYDANDPAFVASGGPKIAPGKMTGTKYLGKGVQPYPVGDPTPVLSALQYVMMHIKDGTSTDSIESGKDGGDQTATEVRQDSARREVRVVDFVDKLEFSIKTFLYMQHVINRAEMQNYSFYNPELDSPDFMRLNNQDIQYNVHFDVIGSRGVLGEEERSQRMSAVTAFASKDPGFSPLLRRPELLKAMYLDSGTKNPERFLNIPTDREQEIIQQLDAQYQQVIEGGKQEIFDLTKKLAVQQAVNGARIQEANIMSDVKAQLADRLAQVEAQMASIRTGLKIAEHKAKADQVSQ